MKLSLIRTVIATLWVGAACNLAIAQTPQPAILTIDLQNYVEYQADIYDTSKFATDAGLTPSVPAKNFFAVTIIADIVAVNGQPARGTYIGRTRPIVASPAPAAGGAIADITRTAMREHIFEIQKSDGTPVGTIMSSGFSGGPIPPGTGGPSGQKGNWAITGGTGAFLGARGQVAGTGGTSRAASMAEDPGYRRINGGTNNQFILHIIPMAQPQILSTAAGPAILHSSDFSPITAANPAVAGEALSVFATGLGPTNPDLDLSLPFPSKPLAAVNSPMSVTANGTDAEILGAVGYPGAVNGYQVNFRLPPGMGKGLAAIQLTAAWIPSTPASVAVQ